MKAKDTIAAEILSIMKTYHEQEDAGGVDTPGGLEHIGDVWRLLKRWEAQLKDEPVEIDLLDKLLELTDFEDLNGKWRVVLEYDNYQDGAMVLDGDGNILGACYDIEKNPNNQFRHAISIAKPHQGKPRPDAGPLTRLVENPNGWQFGSVYNKPDGSIEFGTSACGCPPPKCRGGQCTNATTQWMRTNKGDWFKIRRQLALISMAENCETVQEFNELASESIVHPTQ